MPEPPPSRNPYADYSLGWDAIPEDLATATRQRIHRAINPSFFNQLRRSADNLGIPVSTFAAPVERLQTVAAPERNIHIDLQVQQVKAAVRRIDGLLTGTFGMHAVTIIISTHPVIAITDTRHRAGRSPSRGVVEGNFIAFHVPCPSSDHEYYLSRPLLLAATELQKQIGMMGTWIT